MHDFLTKTDIWVFGGALCDAKKDLGALLSTTENINILLIGSECEDKIEVPAGAHMEKICVKDHDEERVLEAFAKAEAHSGPSVLIIAKAKE